MADVVSCVHQGAVGLADRTHQSSLDGSRAAQIASRLKAFSRWGSFPHQFLHGFHGRVMLLRVDRQSERRHQATGRRLASRRLSDQVALISATSSSCGSGVNWAFSSADLRSRVRRGWREIGQCPIHSIPRHRTHCRCEARDQDRRHTAGGTPRLIPPEVA